MELRDASPQDVLELVALVTSAYRGESSRAGWTTEADLLAGVRTDADDLTALLPGLIVAAEDNELIGCCALTAREDVGYFGTFAVRPTQQGSGIGSRLLTAAEQRAAARGLHAVEMTVLTQRTELLAYYARRGYVPTGERRPFPYGVERYGLPLTDDLEFVVLSKAVPKGSARVE